MPSRSTPRFSYYWAAVLLLPLIALWHQDDVLYSPLWQADAWFYLGYFRDLVSFKRDLFEGFYYGTRLSWILPGYLAHLALPPLAANALMHLGTHTVATASLFRILRSTAGARAAFLTAIFFAAHPWFWCATGWDHVNGAAIAYLMLGMACLAAAAEMPSRQWLLVAAGASLTAAVVAHLFLAALVPVALVYYAGMAWALGLPLKPALKGAAIRLGAGFLAVIVPLSLINGFLIDGHFWFWAPSFRTASSVVTRYQWAESVWQDHRLVPWLWLPIASAAMAVVIVCQWRGAANRKRIAGLLVSAQLLAVFALMGGLQLRGITLLGHYYYACYLLPFTFFAIGHSLWRAAADMGTRTYLLACAAAVALAAAAWYDPGSHRLGAEPWLAIALCALAASLALGKRAAGVFCAIAGLGLLMFPSYNGTNESGRLHATREEYMRVMDARQYIEKRRGDALPLFWYDWHDPANNEYFALDASYIAEFSRISALFPAGCPERVFPRNMVVVSSPRADAGEVARNALDACWSKARLKAAVQDVFPGSEGPNPFTITLLGSQPDYSLQRPLRMDFDLPAARGYLRLVPKATRAEPLPLYIWGFSPGATQTVTSEGIELRTPPGHSDFALVYPVLQVPETGRYRFTMRYTPRRGQVSFGAFGLHELGWMTGDVTRPRTRAHDEVAFSLKLKQGDSLILRISNCNTSDRPSSILLEDVSVFLLSPER